MHSRRHRRNVHAQAAAHNAYAATPMSPVKQDSAPSQATHTRVPWRERRASQYQAQPPQRPPWESQHSQTRREGVHNDPPIGIHAGVLYNTLLLPLEENTIRALCRRNITSME